MKVSQAIMIILMFDVLVLALSTTSPALKMLFGYSVMSFLVLFIILIVQVREEMKEGN